MTKIHRQVKSVDRERQQSLFDEPIPSEEERVSRCRSGFMDPDPDDLFIGRQHLREHLKELGLGWVVELRELVRSVDYTEFEKAYPLQGRPPYAPAAMMGLILYGVMTGKASLRALEQMARLDLGARYVSGGIFPDHSVLGRFIQRHEEVLSTVYFEALTAQIVGELNLGADVLAGDGTTVEAAASRVRAIKMEAAEQQARQLQQAGEKGDEKAQARAERVQRAVDLGNKRAQHIGKSEAQTAKMRVVTTEPEAVYLKQKDGRFTPGYTPSILANTGRVIVAQTVDPTNEIKVMKPLLDQAERVAGSCHTLLLDGLYHKLPVIELAVERDIDLLCPGSHQQPHSTKAAKFPKKAFKYSALEDVVICPAGERMYAGQICLEKRNMRKFRTFRLARDVCENCPLRSQCTDSPQGRTVRRYEGDEAKDALYQVMEQPRAQDAYKQRRTIVEPVFSEMRGVLGLRRMRRFGLGGVRVDFSLYAMAHNLRRWRQILHHRAQRAHQLYFVAILGLIVATIASWRRLWDRRVISVAKPRVCAP